MVWDPPKHYSTGGWHLSLMILHAVWCCYNMANFLLNSHKINPIAHPLGQGMGYILWVKTPGHTLPQSLQWCMQYHAIFEHIITALDRIWMSWFKDIDSKIKIHKNYFLYVSNAWLIWVFVVLITPNCRFPKQIVLTGKQMFVTPNLHKYNELILLQLVLGTRECC